MSRCCGHLKRHPPLVSHKQEWGREFILSLHQTTVLLGSDVGSDGVEQALSFVIQNPHSSCSMWFPMYETRH